MRKIVTPADPKASIPDPSRYRDLPPGGAEVEWSAYWAGMEMRNEVVVSEVPEPEHDAPSSAPVQAQQADAEPAPAAAIDPAPAPVSIPEPEVPTAFEHVTVSDEVRAKLQAHGLSEAEIDAMSPAEAHALVDEPAAG